MNNKTYKATMAEQGKIGNESELLDYLEKQLDANTEALAALLASAEQIRDTQAALRLAIGQRRVKLLMANTKEAA